MAQNVVSPQLLSVGSSSPGLVGLPSSVEVMERLRQLRVWQQQQQEALLRRQQEQLMKLRAHQEVSHPNGDGAKLLVTPERETLLVPFQGSTEKEEDSDSESPLVSDGGSHNESGFPYVPLMESPLSLADDNDILERETGDINQIADTISEQQPLVTPPTNQEDRPLKPAPGSFDDLIEKQLKKVKDDDDSLSEVLLPVTRKPFLRKGQGVTRFGMKQFHLQHKNKPSEFKGQVKSATDKVTPSPSVAESALTRSLVRKVSRGGSFRDDQYFSPLSPSMVRCSSEDSFVIRRNDRVKQEQEELSEFEYLEQMAATGINSSSSQSSLLTAPSPRPVPDDLCTPQGTSFNNQRLSYAPQKTTNVESLSSTDSLSSPALPDVILMKAPVSIANHNNMEGGAPIIMRSLSESTSDSGTSVDLDDTLTPSQAHTMEFNDDEEWNSFNHGSPQSKSVNHSWQSPVRREKLNEDGVAVFTTSLPASTLSVDDQLSDKDTSSPNHINSETGPLPLASQLSRVSLQSLPSPPSALVAKLFPVLRKKEEFINADIGSDEDHPTSPVTKTPSTSSSMSGGDSGKGSLSSASALMNDELKKKLHQLEVEIEKYKLENSLLSKLRKTREEELNHLKDEISEFRRQKDDEIQRFEEYKKDEMKKLKRDRRLFENYQQEARTARDKKDKEEILALRNELAEVHEELRKKESRWGTTLSRYRIKIEGLESRNKELMNDIKVMEEARLEWWQEQILKQSKHHKKNKTTTSRKGSSTSLSSKKTTATSKQPSKKSLKSSSSGGPSRIIPLSDSTNTLQQESTSNDSSWSGEENDFQTSMDSTLPSPEIIDIVSNDYDRGSENEEDVTDDIVDELLDAESAKYEAPVSPQRKKKSVQFNLTSSQSKTTSPATPQHVVMESVLEDGSKVMRFDSGNRKVVSKDGKTESVYFFNGDIKHTKADSTVEYFYFGSKVTHTTYPDGLQVFNFPNHQTEKHYPNGTKEIVFPNKTLKYVHPNGAEESLFPDGTVQRVQSNGDTVIEYTNGQRDTHTKEYKRREYPDGCVKTIYCDGHQETKFPSGRVRVKDNTGKILVDEFQLTNSLHSIIKNKPLK